MTSYKDKEIRLNYNSDNQSLPTNWKNIFSHLGKICSLTSTQNFLSKALLCTLLMFVGAREMWADDYKYIFINNKGNEAFNYIISTGTNYTSIDKTKFCIHPKAKSVLATNFRFYTDKDNAIADANGTIGTYYSEGDAIPDPTNENKTFYVRYNLADDPAININAESVYKLQVRDRTNKWYYIVYDGSANTIKMKTAEGSTDSYFWKFDFGDPYDMYILNLQGLTDNANGVFTVPNVVTSTGEKEESALSAIYYSDKITTGYNQSVSPMALQSFILTQGSNVGFNYEQGWQSVWSNSFQIIGAYNGLDNKPRDTGGTSDKFAYPGNMAYYVCANTAANNNPLQFYRNWRVEDTKSANVSQIKFIVVTQKYKFHIINNSGEEAISMKTDNALNAGATIEETMIPNMLKSPAACNYTFYPTAADAAAKTNAITTLPQDDDIYVRYETSSSDIYLNGGMKYNLSVGGAHYLYAADDATPISSTATSDAVDSYRWALYGYDGDPYQFTIKNKKYDQFITYDVSGDDATPTLSATGSKFFLHQSTSGKYELVAVPSNNYPTSYYTLGYGTDGLKLYSNTKYSFGADEIQTVFTPIPAAIINPLPTANNRTYDGSTQNLITAGTCEHGTIKYSEDPTGEYVEDIPKGTNAGTYLVYYMSEGKDGYEDFIATDPIEVTISPALATVTAENKSKTYGETDPTLTATVTGLISGESESLIKYTLSRVVGEDAKTYTITPTGDALQDNYVVSFVKGTFTINSKTVGITWGETSFPYNGTQQAPTATATGLVNNDEIGITVSGVKTNVGTYTATASGLTGTKKGNYQLPAANEDKTTSFSIVKAAINTSIVMTEWSYGDYVASTNSPSLSFNPENVTVTYLYKVKGADDETYVAAVPTAVGTYTVQTSLPETGNHDRQIVTKDFSISQKALSKDAAGSPANGITVTVEKNTETTPPTYNVTVTHNYLGTPTTLVQYVDDEHDYDYEVSGSQSVSGHVITVTAKNENGIYSGNYTGFARAAYAEPTFYKDGAIWSPNVNEYAAVYLGIYDVVPNPVESESEIKAYIVNKVNPTIGTVTVSPVEYTIDDSANPPTKANYIPEGVPVLLLSNNVNSTGFQTSSTTEDTSDITAVAGYNNRLRIAPEGGVPVKDTEAYVFYRGEFVLTKEGTISPGKFFLYNPNYTPSAGGGGGSSGVRSLRIVMDEDEDPTGIDNGQQTMVNEQWNDIWYTLDGRRLESKPTRKGIYITNGKKIYFK